MTTTDTTVSPLIINKLTKAQYNSITPNPNELYFVTDETQSDPDSVLSTTSENAVQNKVITTALNAKISTSDAQTAIKYIYSNAAVATISNGNVSLTDETVIYKLKPSSSTTFTFDTTNLNIKALANSGTTYAYGYTFELLIDMSTLYALTFPSTVQWQDNETPDLSSTGLYLFAFRTFDGTNWIGSLQGLWGGVAVPQTINAIFVASNGWAATSNFVCGGTTISSPNSVAVGNKLTITIPKNKSVAYSFNNTWLGIQVVGTVPSSSSDVTINVETSAGCVLYNTPILMADGTTKEAQNIKLNDLIISYNENTEEFEENKIIQIIPTIKNDIIKITLEDDSFIELTSGHPILTDKGWSSFDNSKTRKENLYNGAELYQLKVGDKCLTDSDLITIKAIEYENIGDIQCYDFTVENAHTFCAGNCKVILHNLVTGGGG